MKTQNLRRSITFSRKSSLLNESLDLNSSLQLDSEKVLRELSQQESLCNSIMLTERSGAGGELQDCDIKNTKKKMGIQLSILEKNILGESNSNVEKPKRLNRSGFLKGRESIGFQGSSNENQIKKIKSNALQNKKKTSQISQDYQITSFNLQQIRKIDKQLYQLYVQLHHDCRDETLRKNEKDKQIEQLKAQLEQEQEKYQATIRQIQRVKTRQVQCRQKMKINEQNWLRSTRKRLLQGL